MRTTTVTMADREVAVEQMVAPQLRTKVMLVEEVVESIKTPAEVVQEK